MTTLILHSTLLESKRNMAKASSLADNLVKELECAVCLEQYKEPKVLPCLHSFCKTCLEGLLLNSTSKQIPREELMWMIDCPSCRLSVEVSLLNDQSRLMCRVAIFLVTSPIVIKLCRPENYWLLKQRVILFNKPFHGF